MHTPRGLIVKYKHLATKVRVKYPPKTATLKHQLLLQDKKYKAQKWLNSSTFGQTKNHLSTKFLLSIDGI